MFVHAWNVEIENHPRWDLNLSLGAKRPLFILLGPSMWGDNQMIWFYLMRVQLMLDLIFTLVMMWCHNITPFGSCGRALSRCNPTDYFIVSVGKISSDRYISGKNDTSMGIIETNRHITLLIFQLFSSVSNSILLSIRIWTNT